MDIVTQCSVTLNKFGYEVASARLASGAVLCFEDDSLIGFVWVAQLAEIIAQWEKVQDEFAHMSANKLRRSPVKTWNLYMICLSPDRPTLEQQGSIASILENFRGARKIVQGGIVSEAQLTRALYPLIRIQNLVALESGNPAERVRVGVGQLPPLAMNALLAEDLDDHVAVTEFLRAHDIKAD